MSASYAAAFLKYNLPSQLCAEAPANAYAERCGMSRNVHQIKEGEKARIEMRAGGAACCRAQRRMKLSNSPAAVMTVAGKRRR